MAGIKQEFSERKDSLWRERETLLTGIVLIAFAALAWMAVVRQAALMQVMARADADMSMVMADETKPILLADAMTYLAAWGVMMAAMMLPSATPVIALYGAMHRNFSQSGQKGISVALFALVYLAVWLLFGVPIYAANVVIDLVMNNNPIFAALVPYGVAFVLLAAGAYQLTPLKRVCLRACQSPLGFLMGNWRSGYGGTLRMALKNAGYCMGCCWGLMVVLVAAGAMALHWVLLIAVAVFAEKVLPRGEWTARFIGGALIFLGILVVLQPGLAVML